MNPNDNYDDDEHIIEEADANNAEFRQTDGEGRIVGGEYKTVELPEMTLETIDNFLIQFENEINAEDERVRGTTEMPNYGEDWADLVYICRQMHDELKRIKSR